MIDLTLNDKDRDNFILKVGVPEEANKYMVKYASGRVEEFDFSLHNLNATLYRMEEQFLQYRDAYVKNNYRIQSKLHAKKLIEALVALLGTVFAANMPIPEFVKWIIAGIICLYTFLYQLEASNCIKYGRGALQVVRAADKFLEMKDSFKIKITDPMTGLEEDWYMVTLSGIDTLYCAEDLELVSKAFTEETKKETKDEIEGILQKAMSK